MFLLAANPPRRCQSRVLRLLPLALCVIGSAAACSAPEKLPDGSGLNILLVSIDTLRADHLGCYGYSRPTSPVLDAFAAEGARFANAISQAPWTTPSHMTMLTGLYPSTHKMNQSWEDFSRKHRVLADETTTLAEVLQQHGYRTLAQVGGASVAGELGFSQGFDEYRERPIKLAEVVFERVSSWLDQAGPRPFFLFLHTFEVHAPYHDDRFATGLLTAEQLAGMHAAIRGPGPRGSSDIWRQRRYLAENDLLRPEVTTALYDGGIGSTDEFMGRIFDALRQRGLYNRTLIIVTSDHGEEFAEHNEKMVYDEHGHSQYSEMVHVPLLLRLPGYRRPGRVIDSPVGLVDVVPTILDLVGIAVPAEMQGRSLASLLVSDRFRRDWVLSEATKNRSIEIKALRTNLYSYIADFRVAKGGDRSGTPGPLLAEQLFDRIRDPMETINLAAERQETLAQIRQQLQNILERVDVSSETRSIEIDPALEESLRALGYL